MQHTRHRRVDGTGRNRIGSDAMLGELDRHLPGESDDGGLGGPVAGPTQAHCTHARD